MVWAGNNSYPIGQPVATNIITADGIAFDLWAGTNSGAGYYVYSFAPHEKTEKLPTEGSLNVDMMQFLRLLDGREYFNMDLYLDVVEAGSAGQRLGDVRLVQLRGGVSWEKGRARDPVHARL